MAIPADEMQEQFDREDNYREPEGPLVGGDKSDEADADTDLISAVKNDPEMIKFLRDSADRLIDLKKQRQAINEEMKSVRENIVAKGINRHGFDAALKRYELEETDRNEREVSYQASCVALGVEHQLDMFQDLAENAPRVSEPTH